MNVAARAERVAWDVEPRGIKRLSCLCMQSVVGRRQEAGAIWCSAGAEAWDEQDTDSVKCWGRNNNGQLGDGTTVNRHSPVDPLGR